jgi:hypothetical protein
MNTYFTHCLDALEDFDDDGLYLDVYTYHVGKTRRSKMEPIAEGIERTVTTISSHTNRQDSGNTKGSFGTYLKQLLRSLRFKDVRKREKSKDNKK